MQHSFRLAATDALIECQSAPLPIPLPHHHHSKGSFDSQQ